ncbi:hypothetical protein BD779DRAFT_1421837, partial [Infundibulicybe gibba]
TLVHYGFLGATPERPEIAFTFLLLRLFRQLHRVCPRLSIDAFAKCLNHLHHTPHNAYLADQFSNAYDCYLEILRHVKLRTDTALGRDKTWSAISICPPCFYKTVGEPALKYSFLAAMDGNNSLKLVDSTFRAGSVRPDDRVSGSPRWITPEEVDLFKDEATKTNGVGHPDTDADGIAWLNVSEHDELAQCLNTCVERWRAASPEARKKMHALFAVAGIFLAVCRHGHVLAICDMIRSGELMKYPLAIVNRLFNVYGANIGLGYDIMCAFIKTLSRSSLGEKTVTFRLQGVVPSFHGHAHNRACQTHWHPMYMEGVGLEDFEECEQTFGRSNELAGNSRLSTPFHRHQNIDEHFAFRDEDKFFASGNFIFENYRQAQEKLKFNSEALDRLAQELGTTAQDYENYLWSECEYLKNLRTEPPEAKAEFSRLDWNIISNGYTRVQIADVRTRYRTTASRWVAMNDEVCRFEEENHIDVRWTPDSKDYNDALCMMSEWKYRRALDNLERLVVQRLFELTKLGMNGVGYKLREKISKALKTRADAIRNALTEYNEAASQLSPPREQLTWLKVINAVSLADLDILRDARTDIRTLPWAQPARREATTLYFGMKRAKEEIVRLNVEIQRLVTFMSDEHAKFYDSISQNIIPNPFLAHELSSQWEYQNKVHTKIARQLAQTSRLKAFTGHLAP